MKTHIKLAAFTALVVMATAVILFAKNVSLRETFQKKKYICNSLSPKETAKIHKKNNPDVKIVWNSRKGLWDKQQIKKVELVHELTFGSIENEENKIFHRVVNVVADQSGNIYVNELFQGTIRKYSENGDYLLSIGGQGQGPGELSGFNLLINFDKQNNLHIFDFGTNRVSIFKDDGQYLNSVNLSLAASNPSRGFIRLQSGFFISIFQESSPTVIHSFDKNGKLLNSFGIPVQFKNPMTFVDFDIQASSSGGPIAFIDSCIYFTQTNPFEIRKYDLNGSLRTVIYWANDIVRPAMMELIKRDTYSTHAFSMARFIGEWNGYIVNGIGVVKNHGKDINFVINFLDTEGILLTNLYIKDDIDLTSMNSDGKLYGSMKDSTGYQHIVRYRLVSINQGGLD